MYKKILAILLALVMVLGAFSTVFADGEETVEKTEEASPLAPEHIEFMKEHGLIKGDNKGDLMLDKEIDRASFSALLVRADNKEETAAAVKSLGSRFKDMTTAHWANGYANVSAEQGWMKGNAKGEFMPGKTISYAEIATTLVRYLGVDTAGYVYPTSYISKAYELGLFEGIREIADYNQPGIREDIIRMMYNAISREDFGRYTVYKMIVLENARTAQLGAKEIKAEILSIVQKPNKVDVSRGIGQIGDQIKFNLKDTKWDAETLLGKVGNFTIDEKGKLVKVVIDNSYDYLIGRPGVQEKNLYIAGRNYSVRVDEKYFNVVRRDDDNRMYRTYNTAGSRADNYHYYDFYKAVKEKKINPNLARVTAKDGMVIFIDAYSFKDIAPIKEVKRDGSEVFYYNDARDGIVERLILSPYDRIIGYTAEAGFHQMTKEEIKAEDVIHWFEGFYLVRRDAKTAGKLDKTYIDKWGEFAKIGDDIYYLNTKQYSEIPFQSVYAYDNKSFRRLDGRQQINDMIGDEVTVLLDVAGDVQLISSGRTFNDGFALVMKVVSSKGIEYFAPNAEDGYALADDWGSNYFTYYYTYELDQTKATNTEYLWNNTQENRYADFKYLDLVYVRSNEEKIALTALVKPVNQKTVIENKKRSVQVGFPGYIAEAQPAEFEARYQRYLRVGTTNFRFGPDTDVFVVNQGDTSYYPVKATMADVMKYNMKNKDLRAWVLSEKDFLGFLEGTLDERQYNRLQGREDFARVIVFTNYAGPQNELLRPEFGRVHRIWNYANEVEIELRPGIYETFKMTPDSKIIFKGRPGQVGDIIEFQRVKDAEEPAARMNRILESECYKVVSRGYSALTLMGPKGQFVLQLDQYVVEFGDTRDNYVKVYRALKDSAYADILVYSPRACQTTVEGCTLSEIQKLRRQQFLDTVDAMKCPGVGCKADADLVEAANKAYDNLLKSVAGDKSHCVFEDEKVKEAIDRLETQNLLHGNDTSAEELYKSAAAKIVKADADLGDVTKAEMKDLLALQKQIKDSEEIYKALDSNEQTMVSDEKTKVDEIKKKVDDEIARRELEGKQEELQAIKDKAQKIVDEAQAAYDASNDDDKKAKAKNYLDIMTANNTDIQALQNDQANIDESLKEAKNKMEVIENNKQSFDKAIK